MPGSLWDDSEEDDGRRKGPDGKRLKDWDCPSCNANNPSDDVVGSSGVELRCNYCGLDFLVTVNDEGRFRFREI